MNRTSKMRIFSVAPAFLQYYPFYSDIGAAVVLPTLVCGVN